MATTMVRSVGVSGKSLTLTDSTQFEVDFNDRDKVSKWAFSDMVNVENISGSKFKITHLPTKETIKATQVK